MQSIIFSCHQRPDSRPHFTKLKVSLFYLLSDKQKYLTYNLSNTVDYQRLTNMKRKQLATQLKQIWRKSCLKRMKMQKSTNTNTVIWMKAKKDMVSSHMTLVQWEFIKCNGCFPRVFLLNFFFYFVYFIFKILHSWWHHRKL